ncbi:MAG: tRNA (cytidine(56)-2'-O)-methyltransferase [Euryarchaeota archaeon]|jgi:tRNA (cytidine56-2'-O)-methyltransferase|nr:tRNA (cytidine(56)-2'-O)-methyltransferase [Euryarchaeota archaeon]MBT4407735.1 tRNA (cytidine(56)-2'-O)-methyltransferase [Euryarchaeota archaeon]
METPQIAVLRLGHRLGRDPRITTHLGLVARTFGADKFFLAGDEDQKMFDGLTQVDERFGKVLDLEYVKSPMRLLRRWVEEDAGDGRPGVAAHLTMYGEEFRKAIPKMRRDRPLLIVVGGAKVPGDVYKLCQYNVSVGSQPHSEVAALALFLDSWGGSIAESEHFKGAQLEVIPNSDGKTVIDHSNDE